jgi:hypothetical protein
MCHVVQRWLHRMHCRRCKNLFLLSTQHHLRQNLARLPNLDLWDSRAIPWNRKYVLHLLEALLRGQMATTIPAIKPLVARHFPNILGHNFTRRGTTDAHMRSLEPYPERNAKSPVPDSTSEFVRIPSPVASVNEKDLVQAKSKPLILPPVVSAFSTYGMDETALPVAEWKGSHLVEGDSSSTSISSSDATWTPK